MADELIEPAQAVVEAGLLELTYAPPLRRGRQPAWVIAGGMLTTTIVLIVTYLVAINLIASIMDWHVVYIFPMGALLLGLVAGSGYGIASRLTGVRIYNGLTCLILSLGKRKRLIAEFVPPPQVVDALNSPEVPRTK
jgi:hypothetical protein